MNDTPEAMLARLQAKLAHAEAEIAELIVNQSDALSLLMRTYTAMRGQPETNAECATIAYRQQDVTTARGEYHLALARQMEILAEIHLLIGEDRLNEQYELFSAEQYNYGYDAMAIAADDEHNPLYHLNRGKAHEYAAIVVRMRAKHDALSPAELAKQVQRAEQHEAEAERHKGIFEYLTGRDDDNELSK